MAEGSAPATKPASSDPGSGEGALDDILHAADQTRVTARWLASALGTIPALGIVSAFIRAPGDQGFDETRLTAGLLLVAAGAIAALAAFVNVIRPVGTVDKDLDTFDIRRVPGCPYPSMEAYKTALGAAMSAINDSEEDVRLAKASLAPDKVTASGLEAVAIEAEARAKKNPRDHGLAAKAAEARTNADAAKAAVAEGEAKVAGAQASVDDDMVRFRRLNQIRANATRIRSADVVGDRFIRALLVLPLAGLLLVFGTVQLALAPISKADKATSPTLVTLTLNATGQSLLNCPEATIQAIRVGGDDAAPVVITLPTAKCPLARTVTFKVDPKAGLGSVTDVTVLDAPTVTGPPIPSASAVISSSP
jgi:hypothetical protein